MTTDKAALEAAIKSCSWEDISHLEPEDGKNAIMTFDKPEHAIAYSKAARAHLAALTEPAPVTDAEAQDILDQVETWSKAYPLDVFPEPDFEKARELLAAGGITLGAVSASNMRHVITKVWEMLKPLRALSRPAIGMELLNIDTQRLELFKVIEAIWLGNKTDDKLILANLRKAGFCIAKIEKGRG